MYSLNHKLINRDWQSMASSSKSSTKNSIFILVCGMEHYILKIVGGDFEDYIVNKIRNIVKMYGHCAVCMVCREYSVTNLTRWAVQSSPQLYYSIHSWAQLPLIC